MSKFKLVKCPAVADGGPDDALACAAFDAEHCAGFNSLPGLVCTKREAVAEESGTAEEDMAGAIAADLEPVRKPKAKKGRK